ncbi:MAG TPA: hypothetical protein VGK73_25745 [Polyangiaceae bacterium]
MESSRLPLNGTRLAKPDGEVLVWAPGQGLLVASLRGNGYFEFSRAIIERFDEQRIVHKSLALFFDAGRLERYESPLRTTLTEHFLTHRKAISRLEVFARSRMVTMGVSVASLALGGLVKAHANVEPFRRSLEAALADRGVMGFSSDVLEL